MMDDLYVKKLLEQVRRTCKVTRQEDRAGEIQESVRSNDLDWIVVADMELRDIKEYLNVNLRFAELLRKSALGDRERLLAGGTVFKCTVCVSRFAYKPALMTHMELEHGASSKGVKQEIVSLEDEGDPIPPAQSGDGDAFKVIENVQKYE